MKRTQEQSNHNNKKLAVEIDNVPTYEEQRPLKKLIKLTGNAIPTMTAVESHFYRLPMFGHAEYQQRPNVTRGTIWIDVALPEFTTTDTPKKRFNKRLVFIPNDPSKAELSFDLLFLLWVCSKRYMHVDVLKAVAFTLNDLLLVSLISHISRFSQSTFGLNGYPLMGIREIKKVCSEVFPMIDVENILENDEAWQLRENLPVFPGYHCKEKQQKYDHLLDALHTVSLITPINAIKHKLGLPGFTEYCTSARADYLYHDESFGCAVQYFCISEEEDPKELFEEWLGDGSCDCDNYSVDEDDDEGEEARHTCSGRDYDDWVEGRPIHQNVADFGISDEYLQHLASADKHAVTDYYIVSNDYGDTFDCKIVRTQEEDDQRNEMLVKKAMKHSSVWRVEGQRPRSIDSTCYDNIVEGVNISTSKGKDKPFTPEEKVLSRPQPPGRYLSVTGTWYEQTNAKYALEMEEYKKQLSKSGPKTIDVDDDDEDD